MNPGHVFDVVVVGSVNIDIVASLPRRPEPGETVSGNDLSYLPGGKGANQAGAAARSGARTALIAAVGDDPHGSRLIAGLAAAGVDTNGCTTTPASTGTALITVTPDGENTIVVIAGANATLEATAACMPRATSYLTQLEIPLPTVSAVARHAEAHGARFVLNASPARHLPDMLLRLADPLIVNRHEAESMLRRHHADESGANPAAALRRVGIRAAVVTLGPAGAAWATAAGSGTVAAPTVTPVDTTGAGDAFAGTLTAALAQGTPMPQAVALANDAGARATQWHGAVPWTL